MEIEFHQLSNLSSLKLSSISNTSNLRDIDNIDDDLSYTSLKDIINLSRTCQYTMIQERYLHYEFISSDISIRNKLVKRAASAYLQSAVVLANSNRNSFERFWWKVKLKVATCYYLILYLLRACFQPVYRFIAFVGRRCLT